MFSVNNHESSSVNILQHPESLIHCFGRLFSYVNEKDKGTIAATCKVWNMAIMTVTAIEEDARINRYLYFMANCLKLETPYYRDEKKDILALRGLNADINLSHPKIAGLKKLVDIFNILRRKHAIIDQLNKGIPECNDPYLTNFIRSLRERKYYYAEATSDMEILDQLNAPFFTPVEKKMMMRHVFDALFTNHTPPLKIIELYSQGMKNTPDFNNYLYRAGKTFIEKRNYEAAESLYPLLPEYMRDKLAKHIQKVKFVQRSADEYLDTQKIKVIEDLLRNGQLEDCLKTINLILHPNDNYKKIWSTLAASIASEIIKTKSNLCLLQGISEIQHQEIQCILLSQITILLKENKLFSFALDSANMIPVKLDRNLAFQWVLRALNYSEEDVILYADMINEIDIFSERRDLLKETINL